MLHSVAAVAQRDQSTPVVIDQRALYYAGDEMLNYHRKASQGSMMMLAGATLGVAGVAGSRSQEGQVAFQGLAMVGVIAFIAGTIRHHGASRHIGNAGTVLISASGIAIKKKPRKSK